ncbi:HAD family hydrolase [Streptomyces maoxianensis]|uniref:HAD family hydrolase n=1 Tax=Streptomyces maoxianensis TaxID=1459942 RepID=A0ABV9G0Y2_9ACTN
MTPPAVAAFFDVDGTLTTGTTLFRFLEYRLAADGFPPSAYRGARQRLKAMTAVGVPRAVTNRAYFENYANLTEARVAAVAEDWFRAELRQGGFFNPAAVAAFRSHAAAGDLTVLVSGSFPACLAPMARYLGADLVLCSQPEIRDGRYTGAVHAPMIGVEKASAVRRLVAERAVSAAHSWAYGDHDSDLPLLELVGFPVVVGDEDRVLADRAARLGWRRLPGAAVPPPALPSYEPAEG